MHENFRMVAELCSELSIEIRLKLAKHTHMQHAFFAKQTWKIFYDGIVILNPIFVCCIWAFFTVSLLFTSLFAYFITFSMYMHSQWFFSLSLSLCVRMSSTG